MLTLMEQAREPFVATDEEALIAREAADKLRPLAEGRADVELRVAERADIVVSLPARAVEMIVEFLAAMAERKPVSILPHTAELTTQQAADILNVSRPYLVGLIDGGKIPHRMVGTHRRILMSDLMSYKKESVGARQKAIRSMVEEAQKLGLP